MSCHEAIDQTESSEFTLAANSVQILT